MIPWHPPGYRARHADPGRPVVRPGIAHPVLMAVLVVLAFAALLTQPPHR